jgi:hypothetical protein
MTDSAETRDGEQNIRKGWNPSRGFWIGMIGVAMFAGALAAAGAYAASNDPEPQGLQQPIQPAPTVVVSYAPRETTPPDDFTSNPNGNPSVALAPSDSAGAASDLSGTASVGEDGPAALSDAYSSSTVLSPTPVASSWAQSPVFVPPAPAAPLAPAAEALVAYANGAFGIDIITEGQDWGDDEAAQTANIGAVVSAWQRLPLQVTSSIVEHPHGGLQILSNEQGRTSGGWQPYGNVATSFYTNSDQGVEGYRASHQIVLATGADLDTALHELLHAYALRGAGADEYVAAFLADELQSFMGATGWQMLISEDGLLASSHEPWDVVNSLFAYAGAGPAASNPLEAFASAGAAYYAGGGDGSPEAAWFAANLG